MPIDPILPMTFVQDMGPTGKLAQEIAARPEVAQAMAKTMAQEMFKEQSEQVQKPEESEHSSGISEQDERGSRQQASSHHRQRHTDEDEEETPAQGLDPFVGKLVNKKI